jgi:hypothetical protein
MRSHINWPTPTETTMHDEIPTTLRDKIDWLWEKKYQDAIGCGRSEETAEAYANAETAELRSRLEMKITVRVRHVYGNRTIYPVCGIAQTFANIAGTTTLPFWVITAIKNLGYTVEVEQEAVTL